MEPLSHPSKEKFVPITIRITEHDIAEMDYHLNECPMSHPALNNAVTFALERKVKPNYDVAVHVGRSGAQADIGPWTCPLGEEIGLWLGKMLTGCRVQPARFRVVVPKAAVKSAPECRTIASRNSESAAELAVASA